MIIEQKESILNFLKIAYSKAKASNDADMMCRLSRAIVAFSCDNTENLPSWEMMAEEFAKKQKD